MSDFKILIFGDDPRAQTGFGTITDHLVDAVIAAQAIPIVIGLKKVTLTPYPKAEIHKGDEYADGQGFQTLERIVTKEKPRTLISIGDPWDLKGIVALKQKVPFYWIACTPVESPPYSRYILLSHSPQEYLDTAFLFKHVDRIITYSDFGLSAIKKMLGDAFSNAPENQIPPITRIYLGVDPQVYTPRDKLNARKVFGGAVDPETCLFSCVKVNSMRAGFDTLLAAWAAYLKKADQIDPHLPRRSKLYLHTNVEGSGYPLPVLIKRYQVGASVMLNPQICPGHKFPQSDIIDLYNSTDIAISAARAEGFGLPILESLSCGIPAIVPDWGCPSEYGGNAILRVPIAATYNPDFATTDFAIADIEKMALMMLDLAGNPAKRQEMGQLGRQIADKMTWDIFKNQWRKLIRSAMELATS